MLILGGATGTPPAFAVTLQPDGSVLVTVNVDQSTSWVGPADRKLAAMGIDEQILLSYREWRALRHGLVNCTPLGGADTPSGPPVKVLFSQQSPPVSGAGNTGADNTRSGCAYFTNPSEGNTGNTATVDPETRPLDRAKRRTPSGYPRLGPPAELPGRWQASPAPTNAGDWGLSASAMTMYAPGRPNAIARPAGLAGGDWTGSGKLETPCPRMHRDRRRRASFCCAVAGARATGPGINDYKQACWAVWNAGEAGLMPGGTADPPPPGGSGKFGMPLVRMQSAYLTALERPIAGAGRCNPPDDPQAVMASMTATAAGRLQGCRRMTPRYTRAAITGS